MTTPTKQRKTSISQAQKVKRKYHKVYGTSKSPRVKEFLRLLKGAEEEVKQPINYKEMIISGA